jgi:hypothetical protein
MSLEEFEEYGYIDELKAYVLETLTWATIAFEERYGMGKRLSLSNLA